jgi:hypothetical protein
MSQNRASLGVVAKLSGYEPYVVRPLSARLLAPTKPELEQWIKREELLDIRGRSRKPQIALAREFGVKHYPNPAGGCLLTDKSFSKRLRELLAAEENPSLREVRLLSVGRHFRLSEAAKLIVGRDMRENALLESFFSAGDILLETAVPGPQCLLVGRQLESYLERAAHICAAYSDAPDKSSCVVTCRGNGQERAIPVVVDKNCRTPLRIN